MVKVKVVDNTKEKKEDTKKEATEEKKEDAE